MASTRAAEKTARSQTNKAGRRGGRAADATPAPSDSAAVDTAATVRSKGTGASGKAERGTKQRSQRPRACKVSARLAGERIRGLAERTTDLDLRGQLRQLARLVEHDCRGGRRAAACEAVISTLLESAASGTGSAGAAGDGAAGETTSGERACGGDEWLVREAATWAVARLVKVRQGAGGTGGIVERLAGMARQATDLLAGGDTAPAQFVLVLSRLFADLEACRLLEQDARSALVEEIGRLVSPAGSVRLPGSAAMIDRVVRWTAVRDAARATGGPAWPVASAAATDTDSSHEASSTGAYSTEGYSTEARWAAAALAALRLLGGQGRILTAAGRRPAGHSAVLLEALDSKGSGGAGKIGRRTARVLAQAKPARSSAAASRLLPRAMHDADAAMAVMRSDWAGDGIRVVLDYRTAVPRLEIAVADRLLLDGPWQWAVTVDGAPLEVEGGWTASCWESDRKATFLEITAPLGGGRQLERQVVLLPRERIVVLADAVTFPSVSPGAAAQGGLRPAENGVGGLALNSAGGLARHAAGNGQAATGAIDYRSVLPLASGLEAEPAEETREVFLYDATMRSLVMPLAVSEWRGVGRGGFEPTPAGLTLSQTGRHRLYAPVWIDCDAARIGGPLTWRQLTVADTRIILPAHQAAGFRVQSGDEQWLLYKTLDAPRNRTLLGCNVSCDFLLGRLKRSGEVARTLEIQ